ncbi:DUF2057 family protein [Marinobacter sp.]|uniref:YccT family protein n=1 Tax=Marinobacter sp. TaxID=50741 RepID=UPI003568DE48
MKLILFPVLMAAITIPAHVQAEVNLRLGEGVSLHAVNGKSHSNKGFLSGSSGVSLDNGVHQIVVDYQVEIGRTRDDSVIERSDSFVILFETEDRDLVLSAPSVGTQRELDEFNDNPLWKLMDKGGNRHDFQLDVLEKEGFQLVRDYERELSRFNKTDSPAALHIRHAGSDPAARNNESISSGDTANDQHMVRQMLRYWYLKADENTKSEMKRWIRSGE